MLTRKHLRIGGGILLLAFIFIIIIFFNDALTHLDKLQTYVEPYGSYAPLIFILLYTLITIAFIPGTIFTLLGGILFGPWLGTLYSLIGLTLGAAGAFFISRTIGRNFIQEHLGKRFPKLHDYDTRIGRNSFLVTFILRILPFIPYNVLNYALGLTKMRFRGYLLGTFLGSIPATFAYANLAANATNIRSPKFIIAVIIFILALLIPYFISKKMDKSNTL